MGKGNNKLFSLIIFYYEFINSVHDLIYLIMFLVSIVTPLNPEEFQFMQDQTKLYGNPFLQGKYENFYIVTSTFNNKINYFKIQ